MPTINCANSSLYGKGAGTTPQATTVGEWHCVGDRTARRQNKSSRFIVPARSQMSYRRYIGKILLVLIVTSSVAAEVTDQAVERTLRDATRFLVSKQEADGSWPDSEYPNFPTGVTSLCTLALLNAGMTPEDPPIRRALNYLRSQRKLNRTYTRALQTIVLCTAEPEKDLFPQVSENVMWLQAAQRKGAAGEAAGSWGYESGSRDEDPSNAQFALLALYEAERAGVEVKDSTWRLALSYWQRKQRQDGSFGYQASRSSTGSMTCAGMGSLIICSGHVSELNALVGENGNVQCCQAVDDPDGELERAFAWLGKNFSVSRNPSVPASRTESRLFYYLYALERVGRLAGRRFIGRHDWYREGAEYLIERQDQLSGYWSDNGKVLVPTAFSVLFLSKGRRPVLVSKLQRNPQDDWNRHRHDIAHLTGYVEKRWKQDLTWQVVDISVATVADLWQSPVLFLTGRDGLEFLQAEKEALREYIERGGFLFAENCCEGGSFDRDFRALMAELFPDSPLRLLPPDHSIWFAEQRVNPKYLRPLEGLDACCRTGVVYCPERLSCYWELAVPQRSRQKQLDDEVVEEIRACLAIGTNVVTYATGRQLKEKLDLSGFVSVVKSSANRDRASLFVAKLQHNGGSDEAPSALSNLLATVGRQTNLPVATEKRILAPTDPNLPDYPIAFVHGRRRFSWNAAERLAIRTFIENGGVLVADAICANDEFATSFRNEVKHIFPGKILSRIPPDHPLFTKEYLGHDLRTVALNEPRARRNPNDPLRPRTQQIRPLLEGVEMDGQFVVLFSPYDLSCALENRPSLECQGYAREDAAKLATNIMLYAMQQ